LIELSQNILDYIREHFGEEYLNHYCEYYNSEYSPYLRVSAFADTTKLFERLKYFNIDLEPIKNVKNAYRVITGRETVGKTLEFILGHYYIQSLSSMIPPLVLNPIESDTVLDLCAAPGSKTTQLAELMNNKGTLIANEISVERLKSLVFNVDKMSLVNVGILHSKGELLCQRFNNYFDKILVDAPCSALGITQKKGEVSNWWDANKAKAMSDIQMRLLISAIKMCKTGGEIVYSTCTLTLEENEFVLNRILKKYPVELVDIDLPVKSTPGFTTYDDEELDYTLAKTRRILPWEINSEGFFVAKLRKIDDLEDEKPKPNAGKFELIKHVSGKIRKYLEVLSNYYGIPFSEFEKYKYLIKNNDIHFVNVSWNGAHLEDFNRIGTRLGAIDKRGLLQLNSLAAQIFGDVISQNIIELVDANELKIYMNGGTIRKYFDPGGQRVIKFGNYILGTAVASKDGLKSQFPRPFRTQEIIL
jgi:16S rRNA (cytosine1407-C5)-methyltransferase